MYEDFASKLAVTMWPDFDEQPERDSVPAEITDISTTIVDGNFPWTLITIETDTGVTGVGEAYPSPGVREIVTDYLKPVLQGQNPTDVERLYHLMRESLSGRGSQAGVGTIAISGVELALWDATGKLLGQPIYQLLGGKMRDNVLVYADCHAGSGMVESATEADPEETYRPTAYKQAAAEAVSEGFELIKFDLDVSSGRPIDGKSRRLDGEEIEHKRQLVAGALEGAGNEADVAFDLHWNFSLDSATRLCAALEEFDIAWLEDPLPPENVKPLVELNRRTSLTLLTGENLYGRHGFRDLISSGAVEIVAPDVPKTGGIAETKKIAELASLQYQSIAPHNIGSPVATMAAAHVGAAVPNFLAMEFHARDVPWWADLIEGANPIRDGHIRVPDSPGLGIQLNWDTVAKHERTG